MLCTVANEENYLHIFSNEGVSESIFFLVLDHTDCLTDI